MKRPAIPVGKDSPERERLEKVQAELAKKLGIKPQTDNDQKRQGEASIDRE